jgi:peptidoglycan glycosyltransferase
MVMNWQTGEILCMVSVPTFDPNNPPRNIDDDPGYEGVYINRGISAAYTPGSVYKLLTAAAAIENIGGISDRTFHCEGSMRAGDGTINCPNPHGTLTLKDALAVSCNGMFAELSLELGAGTLERYARRYGLSERNSIGRVRTAAGNFEKAEQDTAALAWSGIGQHTNTVCPAAMMRFAGAIANGGVAAPMRLTQKNGFAPGNRIIKRDTAQRLGEMMAHHTRGSFPGLTMHAKSGTAEVGGGLKPHAWFAGYIGNEGFPLAFVVVVENGGGGAAVAGEVANRVLRTAVK